MEEKWKLSKKGSRSCNGRRRVMGAGSASTREGRRTAAPGSFSSRFASLVKEQRARFYIMRRCVTMLICWRDYP
ncbi:DVL family [Musa troglodytarum]|nr:DVL family [Musa troglodytarum]